MLSEIECPIYPELAQDCKDILNKYLSRQITENEFNIELCHISCKHIEYIEDFRCKPIPTKTQDFSKWKFLSKEEKEALIRNNRSYYEEKIDSYLNSVDHITNKNNRNKKQLILWMRLNINRESRILVERMLNTYSSEN